VQDDKLFLGCDNLLCGPRVNIYVKKNNADFQRPRQKLIVKAGCPVAFSADRDILGTDVTLADTATYC
jgi:hypothetical protein